MWEIFSKWIVHFCMLVFKNFLNDILFYWFNSSLVTTSNPSTMNRGVYGVQQRQANNFMGGGGGGGGGGPVAHHNPPNHLSIGTNTNNQDPAAKASRIFIGNLNPLHADRQKIYEIFREYGTITGMSLQKGYGFIQFTTELEARAAVEAEHGRRLGTHNPQHLGE